MQKRRLAPLGIVCIALLLGGCAFVSLLTSGKPGDMDPRKEDPAVPAASQAAVSTQPPVTLAQPETGGLVLSANTMHESSEAPRYEIDARWPLLERQGSPGVEAFNQAAESFAYEQARLFKENLNGLPDDPIFQDSYSSLKIDFAPTSDSKGIFAVLFHISYYSAGAAHPGSYSHAINYDLRVGKVLALEDLFVPGADFLPALSNDCIEDLKARQVLEWEDGALPDAKNYQVWNITPGGLLVTFDEYQVASYAAGPQSVTVPYQKLAPLLRPDGPLREYLSR